MAGIEYARATPSPKIDRASFCLLTVKHTGTHAVMEMAEQAGYVLERIQGCQGNKSPGVCWWGHTYISEELMNECRRFPIVTTYRDPLEVLETWIVWGEKKTPGYPGGLRRQELLNSLNAWEAIVEPYAATVIDLNNPDLRVLNEILGTQHDALPWPDPNRNETIRSFRRC